MPSPGVVFIHCTMTEDALTPLHPNYVKVVRLATLVATVPFVVVVGGPVRRARLAVDVTVGDLRLGQHAEALVDVVGEVAR